MNLFKNVKAVVQDAEDFNSNAGTNDYLSGFKLGDILGIYIYGAAEIDLYNNMKFPITNKKDFAIGLFTGMRATDDVTDGYACVSDV